MSVYTRNDQYVFNYDWPTVVKALWIKYPHKELDFVIYNKVVDLMPLDDDTLLVKKIMHCKKYFFLWCYTLEEIKINFKNKVLDLQTRVIAASKAFPSDGIEKIKYMALNNDPTKTLYTKFLENRSTLSKYYSKLGSGFEKGCKIIEERCKEITSKSSTHTQPKE